MDIIPYLPLNFLRNTEHFQFWRDSQVLFDQAITDGATPLASFANAWYSKMSEIDAILKTDPASALTGPIAEADLRRDRAVIGLYYLVLGYSYSTDTDIAGAGDALSRAIAVYSLGTTESISRQSYAEESGSITNLAQTIANTPALTAAVATLGLGPWITEMRAANDAFIALYQQRTAEYGDANPNKVRDLRRDADALYQKLRSKTMSFYDVNDGAAPYDILTSRQAALITLNKQTIAIRQGHHEADGGTGQDNSEPQS